MKKLLSLILALLMVMTVCIGLVACKDPEDPNKNPSTNNNQNNNNDDDDVERIELKLPDVYYGDNGSKQYHILQWSVGQQKEPGGGDGWIPWEEGDIDEDDGDPLNKMILNRNSLAEEKFGVEISAEYMGVDAGYIEAIRNDFSTSSNLYQLITIRSLQAWELISEGLIYDMNEFAETNILHTDQPWWPQDAVQSYTLGESLYLCSTEMLLRDKGATTAMYFNPKIAGDNGLDDFYAMVEDGTWTFEAMIQACEIVSHSDDDDDLMNSVEDMWGVEGDDDDTHMLFNAMGFRYAHIDKDGYIVYDLNSELYDGKDIKALIDIHENYHYTSWNTNSKNNQLIGSEDNKSLFAADQALFKSASLVKTAVTTLRNMKTDYGILPMPKLSVDQENYSSLVWLHHDCVLGIPAATADPEMSAVILEQLSWEGYYSVIPVLYDTILYGRAAKTTEAKRSLQIIFATRSYDPGQYWDDVSGMPEQLLRLSITGDADIVNVVKNNIDKSYENIQKVNKFVDNKYNEKEQE